MTRSGDDPLAPGRAGRSGDDPLAPGRAGRSGGDPLAPGRAGRSGGDPLAPGRAGRSGGDPLAPGRAGRSRLAILDYGMGNLRSVEKALEHVGASTVISSDHATVRAADGVVLPGVGAFPAAMRRVRELGLDELLRERVASAVPVIGLCMGMQLLFEWSAELGGAEGIGLLEGSVEELDAGGLKVPQIGWNPVSWQGESELIERVPDPCALYHANSFAPRPARAEDVLGTAEYGSRFVAVVARPPLYGLQSHPEKSGPDGLRLLSNFVRVCARAGVA